MVDTSPRMWFNVCMEVNMESVRVSITHDTKAGYDRYHVTITECASVGALPWLAGSVSPWCGKWTAIKWNGGTAGVHETFKDAVWHLVRRTLQRSAYVAPEVDVKMDVGL